MKRMLAFVLALSMLLSLAACGGGTSAATMHLRKTEGAVAVSDGEGKDIAPKDNLGLYSGYQVGTQAESYAWIDLDKVKLTKMDANSEIEVVKEDKLLEINVKSGSLFFNVTEPLADDESLNIRTSSMAVGIRGTCGWVTENAAALLEGTVEVTAGDQSVTVNAGEMAVLTEGALEVKPFTAAFVPAFVREEIAEDEKLAETVMDTTGMDLTVSLEDDYPDIFADIDRFGQEVAFAEEIDFEGDGSPELLIVEGYRDERGFDAFIYRKGMERSERLCNIYSYRNNGNDFVRYALVESGGRLYVLSYTYVNTPNGGVAENYQYCGSLAQNDGDLSYWGTVDDILYQGGNGYSYYHSATRNEDGFAYGQFVELTAGEYEAVIQKYTEVRELVAIDITDTTVTEP